ncbi:serine/threonine protein kinase [Penicillium sp. IBT 35674x]|nr:serine/threonine protein kinase [Penicillium sp. IBT 35674x]
MEHLPETPEVLFPVGTLYPYDFVGDCPNPVRICSDEDLFIGHGPDCNYRVTSVGISHKHVRIFTILPASSSRPEIPALVYAQDISQHGTLHNGCSMKPNNGVCLLSNGDVLTLAPDVHVQYEPENYDREDLISPYQEREMATFSEEYVITDRVIGAGGFGRVHMATHTSTGRQVACKMVDLQALRAACTAAVDAAIRREALARSNSPGVPSKASVDSPSTIAIRRERFESRIQAKLAVHTQEPRILAGLNHPNILYLERAFRSDASFYIFTELFTGGDLTSLIQEKGRLEETHAASIIHQVLLALDYLHGQGIVHRDIKPANILMTGHEDGARVVLTDFGISRRAGQERMTTPVGTRPFCAPELRRSNTQGYSKAVDLWALGCVCSWLLLARIPFSDPYVNLSPQMAILKEDLNEAEVSMAAKDFLLRLLHRREADRMGVSAALCHCWIKTHAEARAEASWHSLAEERSSSRSGAVITDITDM